MRKYINVKFFSVIPKSFLLVLGGKAQVASHSGPQANLGFPLKMKYLPCVILRNNVEICMCVSFASGMY